MFLSEETFLAVDDRIRYAIYLLSSTAVEAGLTLEAVEVIFDLLLARKKLVKLFEDGGAE